MWMRKLLPALAWAFLTMLLMGLPGTYFPEVTTFWEWLTIDKIVHVFIFGIQALLLLFAFDEQYFSGKYRLVFIWLILLVTTLFALSTEVMQVYVFKGRDGNLYDFIADVVGVLTGLLAYILHNNYKKKKVNY